MQTDQMFAYDGTIDTRRTSQDWFQQMTISVCRGSTSLAHFTSNWDSWCQIGPLAENKHVQLTYANYGIEILRPQRVLHADHFLRVYSAMHEVSSVACDGQHWLESVVPAHRSVTDVAWQRAFHGCVQRHRGMWQTLRWWRNTTHAVGEKRSWCFFCPLTKTFSSLCFK